jgi:glycosyltransferase involved in cell wall biosynthesis
LESQQLARSDSITFPSQFSLHWLKKQVPRIDEMRMQFIPNGVDVKLLASFKPKIHQRENIACFVGRCSIPKGISVLVRAIPQIFENDPDLKFNIVGPMINSKIRSKLIFLSEKYPGRIQLLGRMTRDQLMPLFAKSSFLVHPSFYETSSIAIMEAMALGLPVVASNIMPLPEIVQDCETGILVEPGNSVHLANAVLKLARLDSDTIIQMREASKAKIYKNYNLNQIASQLILFYEQAISENSCYLSGTQSQGE